MKSERRITWLKPLLWINRDSVLRLRQTRLSNNSRIDAIRRQNSLGSLFLERKTRWNIANAENTKRPKKKPAERPRWGRAAGGFQPNRLGTRQHIGRRLIQASFFQYHRFCPAVR